MSNGVRLTMVGLVLPLLAGCSAGAPNTVVEKHVMPRHFEFTAGAPRTIVEKHVMPRHFKFTTIIEQTEAGPGGWRAACVHFRLRRTKGPPYICTVGVEVPLETTDEGAISLTRAQRVAANSANMAADLAFGAVTPGTPLVLACMGFIETYKNTLWRSLKGTRVKRLCREEAEPITVP